MNQNFPTELFCLEMGDVTGLLHPSHKYPIMHNTCNYSLNKAVYPHFPSRDKDRGSLANGSEVVPGRALPAVCATPATAGLAGWSTCTCLSAKSAVLAQTSFCQHFNENCWTLHLRHVHAAPASCFSEEMFSLGKQVVMNCGGPRSKRKVVA